jgi:hypothetical protein
MQVVEAYAERSQQYIQALAVVGSTLVGGSLSLLTREPCDVWVCDLDTATRCGRCTG